MRTLRVQGDENIAPSSKQTLHQRHKSTGTLSKNMLAVGGLKAAAKRTAFGDVSNTAKTLVTIHDDSVLPSKVHADFVKPLAQQQDKPAALLRPAQRPLNAAPIKGSLNTISSTAEQNSILPHKAPLAELRQQPSLLPPFKRTQSKKLTSIYKDAGVDDAAQVQPPVNVDTKPESGPMAPVHQSLEPRQHKSQPQLNAEQQPAIRKSQSKYFDTQPPQVSETVSPTEPYQDAREDQAATSDEAYENYMRLLSQKKEEENVQENIDKLERQLPAPPASEPEEYWEDEEEEIYDEQGYTTAHSYRSRGDNTTGGATTVLFPKVTSKVKKDLAAATELFEMSRTQEDIEEEAWDTSMVAEYGDEIFSYMRELEVGFCMFLVFILRPRRVLRPSVRPCGRI